MNTFTDEEKVKFFDELFDLNKKITNTYSIGEFVKEEMKKLKLKQIHETEPKFLNKGYYVILNNNSGNGVFSDNEILFDTYSNCSSRVDFLIQEHDLKNSLLLVGPVSSKEKAEELYAKSSDKKRKRSYYLFCSNSSNFVQFGTLKECYVNLKILDYNVSDFEFFGPFKREWEAYHYLDKV